MFLKRIMPIFVVLGCSDTPSTGNHSVGFTFEVDVAVGSDVDAVTVNGQDAPITSGMVDTVVGYSDYDDGMNAAPLEFAFYSSGQMLYLAHAVAGACQDVCAQQGCPDLSMFKRELITETAKSFQVHDFDCLTCEGPSANIYSCP